MDNLLQSYPDPVILRRYEGNMRISPPEACRAAQPAALSLHRQHLPELGVPLSLLFMSYPALFFAAKQVPLRLALAANHRDLE